MTTSAKERAELIMENLATIRPMVSDIAFVELVKDSIANLPNDGGKTFIWIDQLLKKTYPNLFS